MDEVPRRISLLKKHSVIEALLEEAERRPHPSEHTSSYWEREGENALTVVRQDDDVLLQGFSIASGSRAHPFWRAMHALERLSYRPVTVSLPAYRHLWKLGRALASDLSMGLVPFEIWKCSVILAILVDHWRAHRFSPKTFALIGDGSGFLGALVRRAVPDARIYCIDLPRGLVFQAVTHSLADEHVSIERVTPRRNTGASVTFVQPSQIEQIAEPIDCAVNIASMQEMKPRSIADYFAWLRRRSQPQSRFYCVNRQEKILPGGEVIRFEEYPWRAEDEIFLDGPCPYYTHNVSKYTAPHGPTFLGRRIPYLNHFAGLTWHRLVHLAPA